MSQPADTVRAAIRTLKDLGDAVHATVNDAVSSADRDQIAERIRDLPFQAVRLAVAGVGQAIALADKVQNLIEEQSRPDKDAETEPARRPEGPARSSRNGSVVAMPQPNGSDEAARAQRAAARRAERPARSVPNKTTPKPAAAKSAASGTAAKSAPASKKPAAAKTSQAKSTASKSTVPKTAAPAELPVPDYDSASLASVRARLRNLTQADLRKLRSYEKAHAARPAFLTMYDNRMAKLRDTASS